VTTPQAIVDDMQCSSCGYNLRTLAREACCPECGQPVEQSVEYRSPAQREYRSLRRACALTLGGALLAVPMPWLITLPNHLRLSNSGEKLAEVYASAVALLPSAICVWAAFVMTRVDQEGFNGLFRGVGRAVRILSVAALVWPMLGLISEFFGPRLNTLPLHGVDLAWPFAAIATGGFFACAAVKVRGHRALSIQFMLMAVPIPALQLAAYFSNARWFLQESMHPFLPSPLVGAGLPQFMGTVSDWPNWSYEDPFPVLSVLLSIYIAIVLLECVLLADAQKPAHD
jgi:predicted RNA-binding Zn-ribbon protein involved in translation (DUF1610 family)